MSRIVFLRSVERLAMSSVSAFIAFFPAIAVLSQSNQIRFSEFFGSVTKGSHFKDFFFAAIIIAVVEVSNIVDNVIKKNTAVPMSVRAPIFAVFSYYLLILVYGTFHYGFLITIHESVCEFYIMLDSVIICSTLILSILTEVLIARMEVLLEMGGESA